MGGNANDTQPGTTSHTGKYCKLAYVSGFSFDALDSRLKAGYNDTVNTAFRAKIDDLRANSRPGNMLVYDNVLKGIERFRGTKIPFEAVTVDWLRKYERFLIKEEKTASTISIRSGKAGLKYRPERGEKWPLHWSKSER